MLSIFHAKALKPDDSDYDRCVSFSCFCRPEMCLISKFTSVHLMLSFKDVMHKKCTDIGTKQTKIMIFLYPCAIFMAVKLLL